MSTKRRTNAAAATRWLRRAESLARRVVPTYGSKREVIDGYLLRGSKAQGDLVAEVLDLPAYVLFLGFNRLRPGIVFAYAAGAVGSRDDLRPPHREFGYYAYEKDNYLIVPDVLADWHGEERAITELAHIQQIGSLFGHGAALFTLASEPPNNSQYWLDHMAYFSTGQRASVSCSMTSLHRNSISLDVPTLTPGTPGNGYWLKNHMLVDETMTGGWLLHPRRRVPHTSYSTGDPYRELRSPGKLRPGIYLEPSEDPALPDKFFMAYRAFNQVDDIWYTQGPEVPGRRQYYERRGEERLFVSRAEFVRADYDPEVGGRATLVATTSVGVEDIPIAALKPVPPTFPGNDYGRPELPNPPRFLTPFVTPTPEGMVTWCVYTSDNGEEILPAGYAYALMAVLPTGECAILKGDRDVQDGYPIPPTASSGELTVPWIVGAATVGGTAACVVWEHTYSRSLTEPRGTGGRLVLYTSDGLEVERRVLSTTMAATFASVMQWEPMVWDYTNYPGDSESPFANVVAVDEEHLVLAVVNGPPGTPATDAANTVPEHGVYAARVNVTEATIARLGVIYPRSLIYRKCMLTLVSRTFEEKPAVLLAAVTDDLVDSFGNGVTMISYDGGESWGYFVEDMAGQSGSLYAGNLLWEHDIDQRRYWS